MSLNTISPWQTVLMAKNSLKGIDMTIAMITVPQYPQIKEKE